MLHGVLSMLEPDEGKLSRPVLRTGGSSDAHPLSDSIYSLQTNAIYERFNKTILDKLLVFPERHCPWPACATNGLELKGAFPKRDYRSGVGKR